MYYPGWLLAYFLASILARFLGIPYPVAFLLILGTWLLRDRVSTPAIGRLFAGGAALRESRREIALNPANAEAQFQVGSLLSDRGQWQEAVAHLEAAHARMRSSAEACHLLGTALLRAGRPAEAEAALRRAIELDPRFRQGDSYLRLAEALAALGRGEEAYALLAARFGEASTSVEALYQLGVAARSAGRAEEARAAFLRAKEAYGTNPAFRRRHDRGLVIRARQALGEHPIADKVVLAAILAGGVLLYLHRVLR